VGSVLGIGNRFFLQCLPFVCVRELRLGRQCADCSWTFGSVNCYWDLVFCLAAFCTAVCIFYFIFCEEETLSPLALSRSRTLCILLFKFLKAYLNILVQEMAFPRSGQFLGVHTLSCFAFNTPSMSNYS